MTNFEQYKPKQKIKHNYTSELELKSLLIRIKNQRKNIGSKKYNSIICKYINWHVAIVNKKSINIQKRSKLKTLLKSRIITLSEKTQIDEISYERFGNVILLMIKNILTKPQFSGYTYKDDFYSDAIYKILKYLGNFDHNLISERTGQLVNSFAYISQIIHNSILFIINTKKKESEKLKKKSILEHLSNNIQIKSQYFLNQDINYQDNSDLKEKIETKIIKTETVVLTEIYGSLAEELQRMEAIINNAERLNIFYPKSYRISFDEYDIIKNLLQTKVNIMRLKK